MKNINKIQSNLFKGGNKNMENKDKKDRKKTLIVLGISLLTVLGGTLAYFTTSTDIQNLFKTALYQNEIIETFQSPDKWTPGTTTDINVKVTNTGNIGMALRATYEEKWVNADGEEIGLKDSDDNIAALINFNDSWIKDLDGYFYYGNKANMTELSPKEISSSFIENVTFNENIKSSLTETISNDGQIITYTSSEKGYDNATYTLIITIDTIQYDQAINQW